MDLGADAALHEALRDTVGRILATLPGARLACLNVLRTNRITIDTTLDEEGRNKHLQRLIELKHWASPLGLPEGRVTFHVLEAVNPAGAILDHARVNGVDHIVMGARTQSLKRRVLGSVSAEVASEAPCSVTVVRARAPRAAGDRRRGRDARGAPRSATRPRGNATSLRAKCLRKRESAPDPHLFLTSWCPSGILRAQ